MSGVSTNTPVPSRLLFLHEVAKEPIGAKVRFLCCVLEYEVSKAYLYVEHRYPQNADHMLAAAVDVAQVLDTIKSTDLQAGSWLNVIGYVRSSRASRNKRKRTDELPSTLQPLVLVQAVMVWNAGPVKIADYEKTLSHQQDIEKLATESLVKQVKSQ